jgi:hypothetical protein
MTSNLQQHPDTVADAAHGLTGTAPVGVELAILEAMIGVSTPAQVKAWIDGYQ